MADLNPLLRLNKFRLEEKQRALSRLYAEVEKYETEKKAVLDSIESEKGEVEVDPSNIQMMQAFLNYFQKSQKEVNVLNDRISSVEIKINRSIEEMREAFSDFKKIEITRDRRLEELHEQNKKREDDLFAEIALEIYRRSE